MVGGAFLGLYVGVWLLFIGGGIEVIGEAINLYHGNPVHPLNIMIGIIRIMLSGVVGWLIFLGCVFFGTWAITEK